MEQETPKSTKKVHQEEDKEKILKQEITYLKKELVRANEEKRLLSEAFESKQKEVFEINEACIKADKEKNEKHNEEIKKIKEQHLKELALKDKESEEKKAAFGKSWEEINIYTHRREDELQKIINFNENLIKQMESTSTLAKMLHEYIIAEVTKPLENSKGNQK